MDYKWKYPSASGRLIDRDRAGLVTLGFDRKKNLRFMVFIDHHVLER